MKKIKLAQIALVFLFSSCNVVKMEFYDDWDLVDDMTEKTNISWGVDGENIVEIQDGISSIYNVKDVLSNKETVTFVIDDIDILFLTFHRYKNQVTYEGVGWYLIYEGKTLKYKQLLKQF
jgi:hypothetical protein